LHGGCGSSDERAVTEAVQIVPPGTLVWGMQLPVVAQSSLFAAPWESSAGADEIARIARACDDAGFFYVAVCDHVAIPRARASAMSTVWYDTVATLGFLAGVTRRVRLLSHVYVLPYRHPLQTAKAFATLDALSRGRVILGVGAGHLEPEFDALGVPFQGRGGALDEAIDLVAAALTAEYVEHEGKHWTVRDLGLGPRPVQRPRPPIWVGGSSRPAMRRAAERGDGWLPQGTPRAELPAAIAFIRAQRAKTRGDAPIEVGAISQFFYVGQPGFDVGPNTLTGPPDRLAASLRELKAMGVNHCGVRFRARSADEMVDQIAAFGAEVAPRVNA
jgi:probable F420-dependent oxidoreductase